MLVSMALFVNDNEVLIITLVKNMITDKSVNLTLWFTCTTNKLKSKLFQNGYSSVSPTKQ